MSIATTADLQRTHPHPLVLPLAAAAGCVALADWLFLGYPINVWNWPVNSESWQIGISLPLFLAVLGGIAIACNGVRATRKVRILMTAVFVAGLFAVVEDVDILSFMVGTLATAMFAIVMSAGEASSWRRLLREAATVPFRGPFRLIGDLFGALRQTKRQTPGWIGSIVGWIVPLSIFAVFLALFSSANPLIEYQLGKIDLHLLFEFLGSLRLRFWVFIACVIWPLLHRRIKSRPTRQSEPVSAAVPAEASDLDHLLGEKAMSRSLILFNALFALQTVLDLTYLWAGANLPDGMNHAEYAHRGAYPLIVTALLAAGFVLVAMRPSGPAEHSRLIRPLVLLWTGQNILLVISAIFRLDLYVATFSLTYMRLAAFVWMALVAAGLVLILIQIELKKSNSWLLSTNAIALALVLYGCCFINVPRLIASYNVEHSRETAGSGPSLDLQYLKSLGPQAEPALRPHLAGIPALQSVITLCRARDTYLRLHGNWRGWSFRTWRLERYLANNPDAPPNPGHSGKG
jgi:Domain of unknown function (DUF4173)